MNTHQTIQERFDIFHASHPDVYAYLVALAFEVKRKGFRRYGIRPLCERVRWHFQIEKDMGEDFKINDHYLSRYARKLMEEHPELDGLFELRELKAA